MLIHLTNQDMRLFPCVPMFRFLQLIWKYVLHHFHYNHVMRLDIISELYVLTMMVLMILQFFATF